MNDCTLKWGKSLVFELKNHETMNLHQKIQNEDKKTFVEWEWCKEKVSSFLQANFEALLFIENSWMCDNTIYLMWKIINLIISSPLNFNELSSFSLHLLHIQQPQQNHSHHQLCVRVSRVNWWHKVFFKKI